MTKEHPLAIFRQRQTPRMTLRDLATLLEVRPNTVWRWENGRLPNQAKWAIIQARTGVRVEDLARFTAEAAE